MSEMAKLYLEDLRVGQRFTSATYVMEVSRMKEFAAEFRGDVKVIGDIPSPAPIARSNSTSLMTLRRNLAVLS